MIALLLVITLSSPVPVLQPAPTPQEEEQQTDPRVAYEILLRAAGEDTAALWKVHAFCVENSLEAEATTVLEAILAADDADGRAHELLGHVAYEGRWYPSEAELAAYKELAAEMKAKGLVEVNGTWVTPEDAPYIEQGLAKTDDGQWVAPEVLRYMNEGWVLQDLEWIPEEIANIEAGLYKCGSEWKSVEEANTYHAQIGRWWRIPSARFELWTTTQRHVADWALQKAEATAPHVQRIFGFLPDGRSRIVLMNSMSQYNQFAGNQGTQTDAMGFSSFHGAYHAEAWFDAQSASFPRASVAYCDGNQNNGWLWGEMNIRHAAAQTLVEGLDPSPVAENNFIRNPGGQFPGQAFWNEKKIPLWLRYGTACFAETYYLDPARDAEQGGPKFLRDWAIEEQLRKRDGMDPLDTVFAFRIAQASPEVAMKLMHQAGLIVAFILESNIPSVRTAHQAFKVALRKDDVAAINEAVTALQEEIKEHETELLLFAGL